MVRGSGLGTVEAKPDCIAGQGGNGEDPVPDRVTIDHETEAGEFGAVRAVVDRSRPRELEGWVTLHGRCER